MNVSYTQICYNHCKSKVMSLVMEHLNRLFSVHSVSDSTLSDLSIAYGLLLKGSIGDMQTLCDQLSQEV